MWHRSRDGDWQLIAEIVLQFSMHVTTKHFWALVFALAKQCLDADKREHALQLQIIHELQALQ